MCGCLAVIKVKSYMLKREICYQLSNKMSQSDNLKYFGYNGVIRLKQVKDTI